MVNDIVKNILLKFKVDDRELRKGMESLYKGGVPGSPGGSLGQTRALPDQIRQILQLNREIEKSGGKISHNMGIMIKNAKELATVHMAEMQKKLEKTSERAKRQFEELSRLRATGASADQINRVERRLGRTMDVAQARANEISDLSGLAGRPRSTGAGIIGRIGGIAGALGGVVGFVEEWQRQRVVNATALNEEIQRRRAEVLDNNQLRQIMEKKYNISAQASQYSKSQLNFRDILSTLAVIGGVGAAAFGSGGTAIPLIGAASAAGGLYHLMPGRRRVYAQEAYKQKEAEIYSQSMDPYYYAKFAERANGRARAESMLGLTEESSKALRDIGFQYGFKAQETEALALAAKDRLGAGFAGKAVEVAGRMRMISGVDSDKALGYAASLMYNQRGGPDQSFEKFKDGMEEAFKRGLGDNFEKLADAIIRYQETLGARSDFADIMKRIGAGVGYDNEKDPRAISAAVSAYERVQSVVGQGGVVYNEKMAFAARAADKLGITDRAERASFMTAVAAAPTKEEMADVIERRRTDKNASVVDALVKESGDFPENVVNKWGIYDKRKIAAIQAQYKKTGNVKDAELAAISEQLISTGFAENSEQGIAMARGLITGNLSALVPPDNMTQFQRRMNQSQAAVTGKSAGGGLFSMSPTAAQRMRAGGVEADRLTEEGISTNIAPFIGGPEAIGKGMLETDKFNSFVRSVGDADEAIQRFRKALGNTAEMMENAYKNNMTNASKTGIGAMSVPSNDTFSTPAVKGRGG